MYLRFPLSLRNVEDLLFERGIDVCHEKVRLWWNRFGPMFAGEIRRKRVHHMRQFAHWRWHLDEVYVKIKRDALPLPFRRRERAMARFRRMKTLQKFSSVHAFVHNHFGQERHPVSREIYK